MGWFRRRKESETVRYEDTKEYDDRVGFMLQELGIDRGDPLELALIKIVERLKALEARHSSDEVGQ